MSAGPLDIFRLTDGAGQLERCRSKLRYADKKAAVSQINRLTRGHHRKGHHKQLSAYACLVCGGWHLTHRTQPVPCKPGSRAIRGP